jgi:hypothetical protein
MAFQTGSQVNAALGRTDFTPFLQGAMQGAQAQARGAENIAQGLAGLGQQVGRGIEKYSEQKKKNAERDGRINATLGAIQANAKTLERYGRTEEAETLRAAGANILQETDLNKRAAMSQGVIESFLQGIQIESGARQRQLGEQAAQYSGLLEQSGGADVSLESGPISPIAQQQGRAMYLDNLYKQSQIAQNFAAAQPKPKEAPTGYRFDQTGNLEMIEGGPAAVAAAAQSAAAARAERSIKLQETGMEAKLADAQADKEAKQASFDNMAEDAKTSARRTLEEITKAKIGVNRTAAQGMGSGVAKFFAGSAANDLETSYDVIGANEALKQIIELKKNSPTGSTGFGALNLQELIVLKSRFAKLTTNSSDYFALRALDDLEKVIKKAYPDLAEETNSPNKKGFANPNNVPKKSRIEILSVTQD